MGEFARGDVGKVGGWQRLEIEARPARPQQQLSGLAGDFEARLSAFGEFPHDVIDHMRGNGGRAGLGDVGGDLLGRLEVEIGALQRDLAVGGLDQHVGENGDRIAPFDDAMHVSQSLEQDRTLNGDLHRRNSELFVTTDGAPSQGRGLCQGVPASARARSGQAAVSFSDINDFVNRGESFTGP